jgi:predicted AAA+ superfamily ATPase
MKTELVFRKFNRDSSQDELLYDILNWTNEFDFIDVELSFTEHLIKTYPFKNKILNLFERIQLFVKEIDALKEEKNVLLNLIQKHEKQLNGMIECNDLSCDDFYVVAHEKIALEIFNYTQKYRAFKVEINEYIRGITF